MRVINILAVLLITVLAFSCARRKASSSPPPRAGKCDTNYVSPFTWNCAGDTSLHLKNGFCEEYLGEFKTAEGTFNNGKPDGIWKYWFKDDPVRMEGSYKNGVKHGNWNYYENDQLFYTLVYSEDSIIDSVRAIEYVPKEKVYGPAESENREPISNISNLLSHIKNEVCYPEISKDLRIQGTVWVEFIVGHTGEVHSIKIVRSPPNTFEMERECIRVIRHLPRFRPGLQKNRPVQVRYTVPIQFKIR